MLGRTASDLFWLSRYIERAENTARLVDVAARIGLIPNEGGGQFDEWGSALASSSSHSGYTGKYDRVDGAQVVDYLLLDPDNPSSVYCCLAAARQNGRAQRTALTQDMWEALNTMWLEYSSIQRGDIPARALTELLAWIKQQSALFRGALEGTILRNDTYAFLQLGAFVERADNTARILDVKYYVLLPENDMIGGTVDSHQWAAILRSVSAHRSYRWVYREGYRAWRVAEYLILNRQMPRSLAYSYQQIMEGMSGLRDLYGTAGPALELARETDRQLASADMTSIFQSGLHEFLLDFLGWNNRLSGQIARDYHFDDWNGGAACVSQSATTHATPTKNPPPTRFNACA